MNQPAITITKENSESNLWKPLEKGTISTVDKRARRVVVTDGERRCYVDTSITSGSSIPFTARGTAGLHEIVFMNSREGVVGKTTFHLTPRTRIWSNKGPYGSLANRVENLMQLSSSKPFIINDRIYRFFLTWSRDHVLTLKSYKYFSDDVKSGMEYWLESQEPNGMMWDTISYNPNGTAPSFLGEALGKDYCWYDDNMKYVVRRIPVEADCEFLYTEGVWYAWKASGDDAWMAKQLPVLEKALKYNTSHPTRWSKKHKLVKRSFCMDSWDFAHPFYCNGDARCINPGDPQFLFHSDNSGVYASYWRMAEMYEHLGNTKRAGTLRREGDALRRRANSKLFFDNVYGHMIPETLPEDEVYARVGDERKRMSLSTGYTMNRKLPTHDMAVKIIKEYMKRGREKKAESFAEWWTMDPPYTWEQWPTGEKSLYATGEYMNGAISPLAAGEIAKAAFDHGYEEYGADILKRLWKLSERDNEDIYQIYKRQPENFKVPQAKFTFVDMRSLVNRGLAYKGKKGVEAWTGEGANDMRNLPVGKRRFGSIEFDVIDPATNEGKSFLRLDAYDENTPTAVTISANALKGKSIYFLHATPSSAPAHSVVGAYDVVFTDGTVERIWVRAGHEIAHWWNPVSADGDSSILRVAWRGPNPQWKDVAVHMFGWNNPHPGKAVSAIRAETFDVGSRGGIMLGAISFSNRQVQFDAPIRSYGIPACWGQASVYYGIAEGLVGIEDEGRAFDRTRIAPRWAATESTEAEVTLHYPASDGYCSYRYRLDKKSRTLVLDVTGSFKHADVHCLLPGKARARRVLVNGEPASFSNNLVEQSAYADFVLEGLPGEPVVIQY